MIFVGFTLEAKLGSSKHLIQVHLEILSRSVENMASHLLANYITWSKSRQSLRSLESWNRCTCRSCKWLSFLIAQVCSQVWCRPYLAANFGFFEVRRFPWSPSNVEVGTFYPFTFKVGSKNTFIILPSVRPKIVQPAWLPIFLVSRKEGIWELLFIDHCQFLMIYAAVVSVI